MRKRRKTSKAKVRVVESKRMIGRGRFIGMNYYAAKTHKIKFPHRENTVVVYSKLKPKKKEGTIKHEKTERRLMKKGMPYRKAHHLALKAEK